MSDEVLLRAVLARPYLLANTPQQVAYLLLEMHPAGSVAQVRMPVNVAFVLDRSGSMKGDKIDRVRRATINAIEMLDANDTVSVVTFDHRSSVLIPSTSVTDKDALTSEIERIRDAGGTRIAPAVEKALKEIQEGDPSHIRRLILLTDGQTEHEKECLLRAKDAGDMGVPIVALGVGKDWNENLLDEMASRSGGTADFIATPEAIAESFANTVQQAQTAVVQNSVLTLRLVQGVTPRAVWQVIPLIDNLGYRPLSDRDVQVPLGEMDTTQGRTLLIELLLQPRPTGQYRIGQAEVSFDVPTLGIHEGKVRHDILLTFSDDQNLLAQVTPSVMNIVEKVSAFKLQTRALQDLEAGNTTGATQKLQNAVTRLLSQGETDLAQAMQQEVDNLSSGGQLSSEGQKTIKFGTRKTVRLSDLDLPDELRQGGNG